MSTIKKNKVQRWIKRFVFLYVIIGVALYFLQGAFLFHPVQLNRDYQYHFVVPFKEVDMPFGVTDTINLVKFFPAGSLRKGVVIYFHGNKGNINRYAIFANNFTKQGYEVWMEDYPGFGKSIGERNEQNLYQQAEQIYNLAGANCSADSIVIYGKSFGTGIAAYLASVKKCKRLILETPYYSIPGLFACYAPIYPAGTMATYKIPTNQYLHQVIEPITIFHGTDDGVIPYRCAVQLKKVLKATDEFITIPGGTHHNLNDYPLCKQKLDSLLKQ